VGPGWVPLVVGRGWAREERVRMREEHVVRAGIARVGCVPESAVSELGGGDGCDSRHLVSN